MLWVNLALAALPAYDTGADSKDCDTALVAAAQRGSADAFAKLHARYYRRIYHLAHLKTNNPSDAEDVASETFIRALAGLRRFRFNTGNGQTSLYPWLHRIAINLIIDSARQRPPSGVLSLDTTSVNGMRQLLADRISIEYGAPSPQEIVERHEVQQLVRSAIAALPPDQGDALIYRYLGDLSTQEIAPLLNRSDAAVKSLLHRAVASLRGEIERRLAAIERLEAGRDEAEKAHKEVLQSVGRLSR